MPDLRGNVRRHVDIRVRYLDRDGIEHDEIKRGLTAGTFQHEVITSTACSSSTGSPTPRTLTTWEQFDAFHRDAFVERITAFVERVGS